MELHKFHKNFNEKIIFDRKNRNQISSAYFHSGAERLVLSVHESIILPSMFLTSESTTQIDKGGYRGKRKYRKATCLSPSYTARNARYGGPPPRTQPGSNSGGQERGGRCGYGKWLHLWKTKKNPNCCQKSVVQWPIGNHRNEYTPAERTGAMTTPFSHHKTRGRG